jgi:preprotein translocase subunit SecD
LMAKSLNIADGSRIGGLAGTTSVAGKTLRLLQTGNIQSYAFMFGLGVTVIIYYVVVK